MATQFSVDPLLEDVCLLVLFLSDGVCFTVENYDSKGRRHDGGDIIYLERDGPEEEIAVILGWGETEHDAEEMARAYVRRLAKWHGNDKKLEVCGYDLTQSQLFQDDNADNDNSEDSNCDSNTRSGRSFR